MLSLEVMGAGWWSLNVAVLLITFSKIPIRECPVGTISDTVTTFITRMTAAALTLLLWSLSDGGGDGGLQSLYGTGLQDFVTVHLHLPTIRIYIGTIS